MKDILNFIENYIKPVGVDNWWDEILSRALVFAVILLIAFAIDRYVRHVVIFTIKKLTQRTKALWDDILFNERIVSYATKIIAPSIIFICTPIALESDTLIYELVRRLCSIIIIIYLVKYISGFASAVYEVYNKIEKYQGRPLKGMVQIVQIVTIFIAVIVIISILINKSPLTLLAGLGASAAILMLVFKDTIMGFVSGIQLTANDMLKVGDWISMPSSNADGTVIEVTLNTVKVQNWDYTIVTIPPYKLVSDSFQNWRGMQECGGRRILRSINIDMNSVKFCTPEMLDRFRHVKLLQKYIDDTEKQVEAYNKNEELDLSVKINGKHQTNIGVFRAYLQHYIEHLPILKKGLTCMVRQLQPSDCGIPIQVYFFSSIQKWETFEGIQADVMDHILAVIPEFELRVFQSPTGADFKQLHN